MLLKMIDPAGDSPMIRQFVKDNIDRSVSQIRQAQSTMFNGFHLLAGKVGEQQIVSIERQN